MICNIVKKVGVHMEMDKEKERFLNQFAKQALNERISLFLGAGGSSDAGFPSWSELFAPFAEELNLIINDEDEIDYYRLAQYYSNSFGSAELRRAINERINRPGSNKSRLLEELVEVGFSNIWTTNFDTAIENLYQNRGVLINKVFRDADFSNIDINNRINIFKMNGDISNLDGIIATQNDFEKYTDTHKIMLMFFKRELISSTFLFIGYSFKDHLVLDCLSEIVRYLGDSANYHYTILKKDTKDPYFSFFVQDLEKRYHIKSILVDEYIEVPELLIRLNKKIRNSRIFISGAFSSLNQQIEEYSHSLSKALSESLLKADYRIINGIGRRFGTHLIGYANEYLAKHGTKNIERYLTIYPFVGIKKGAEAEKRKARERVISKCGAVIFVFGDGFGDNVKKSGVWEEFEIAKQQHKIIIPIAYPNMISERIWKEIKCHITQYPYLEKTIDLLTYEKEAKSVSELIVQILTSVRDEK